MPLLAPRWEILGPNVTRVGVPFKRNAEWEARHIFYSDPHFDAKHCLRERLEDDFGLIKKHGATWSCHGDLVDGMQGVGDKRQWKEELRPEYTGLGFGYFEAVVDDIVKFLHPYRDSCVMLSDGNHETKLDRLHENRALTKQIIFDLNRGIKRPILYGDYAGWIVFEFIDQGSGRNSAQNRIYVRYHHGSGLKSEAARIRYMMEHPRGDIFVIGHHHTSENKPHAREDITERGNTIDRPALFLQMGGYKESKTTRGWAGEKAMKRGVPGCWEIRFFWNRRTERVEFNRIPHDGC